MAKLRCEPRISDAHTGVCHSWPDDPWGKGFLSKRQRVKWELETHQWPELSRVQFSLKWSQMQIYSRGGGWRREREPRAAGGWGGGGGLGCLNSGQALPSLAQGHLFGEERQLLRPGRPALAALSRELVETEGQHSW